MQLQSAGAAAEAAAGVVAGAAAGAADGATAGAAARVAAGADAEAAAGAAGLYHSCVRHVPKDVFCFYMFIILFTIFRKTKYTTLGPKFYFHLCSAITRRRKHLQTSYWCES